MLGVNTNTALRALRLLRDEGLLEFRRGRGITVTGAAPQRSAVIARLIERGARAESHPNRPRYVGAGEGDSDLARDAERYLRDLVAAR